MFTRMVLMWGVADSEMLWLLLSTADYSASNGYAPPMICTEEDGKVLYSGAELLAKFEKLKYTLVEEAQCHILNASGVEKVNPYVDWV